MHKGCWGVGLSWLCARQVPPWLYSVPPGIFGEASLQKDCQGFPRMVRAVSNSAPFCPPTPCPGQSLHSQFFPSSLTHAVPSAWKSAPESAHQCSSIPHPRVPPGSWLVSAAALGGHNVLQSLVCGRWAVARGWSSKSRVQSQTPSFNTQDRIDRHCTLDAKH